MKTDVPTIEQLNLPPALKLIPQYESGLVLVGGIFIVASDRGMPENEVRALAFFSLVLSIVGLIFVNRSFSASLVTAGGLAYLIADDGQTKVIRPGEKLEVIADNLLGEHCYSSPAIAHDSLFIRGEKHLYCIQ